MTFLWLKAFHIIAVVCWFAALFYLPRLFVYHAMSEDQVSRDRFNIMQRKLYRGIMTPAGIVAVVLGFAMLHLNPDAYATAKWIQIKIMLVFALIGYHAMCGMFVRQFAAGRVPKNHVFFRWFNEFPVLILVGCVLLAVLKPF